MRVKKILFFTAALVLTSTSFAKEKAKSAVMTKDERNQMAEMHSKMADCLKSDKEMSECHNEMMTSCKEMGHNCEMQMQRHSKKRHSGTGQQTTSNDDQSQSVSSSMSSTTTTSTTEDQDKDQTKKEKKSKSKKYKNKKGKETGSSSSGGSESEGHDQTHAVGEEGQKQM